MYVFVKDGIIIILHLYGTQNKCYLLMFIYITENLQEVEREIRILLGTPQTSIYPRFHYKHVLLDEFNCIRYVFYFSF